MATKTTSKNQLLLPAIGLHNGQIALTPAQIQRSDAVRAKLVELNLLEQDSADAVAWARKPVSSKRTRRK